MNVGGGGNMVGGGGNMLGGGGNMVGGRGRDKQCGGVVYTWT